MFRGPVANAAAHRTRTGGHWMRQGAHRVHPARVEQVKLHGVGGHGRRLTRGSGWAVRHAQSPGQVHQAREREHGAAA